MEMRYTIIALCNAMIIITRFCSCGSKSVGMTAEPPLVSDAKNTSDLYPATGRKIPINLHEVRRAEDSLCGKNGSLNAKSTWCDFIRRSRLSRHFVHSSSASKSASSSEQGSESSENSSLPSAHFEYSRSADIDPCPSIEKSDIHRKAFASATGNDMVDIYPSHHVIRTCRHSTPTIHLAHHKQNSRNAYCASTRIRQERNVFKNGQWHWSSVYFENECKLFVKRSDRFRQSQVKSESAKEDSNCAIAHSITFIAITFGIICLLLCFSRRRR